MIIELESSLYLHHKPTCEHSERVAEYSAKLAYLDKSLDESTAHDAGLIHDIGKLLIDKHLLDSSKINKKQYEEIKKHVRYGYDLLIYEDAGLACVAGKHHPEYAVKEWPDIYTLKERKWVSKYIEIVTFADFFDALMTRNNDAYRVDKNNKKQVFEMLRKYFPEKEIWMEQLWKAKEQETNLSEQ